MIATRMERRHSKKLFLFSLDVIPLEPCIVFFSFDFAVAADISVVLLCSHFQIEQTDDEQNSEQDHCNR